MFACKKGLGRASVEERDRWSPIEHATVGF